MIRKCIIPMAVVAIAMSSLPAAIAQTTSPAGGTPWGGGVLVPVGPGYTRAPANIVPVAPQYAQPSYPVMLETNPVYPVQQPASYPSSTFVSPLVAPQTGPLAPSVEMGQLAPGQTLTSPSFRSKRGFSLPGTPLPAPSANSRFQPSPPAPQVQYNNSPAAPSPNRPR